MKKVERAQRGSGVKGLSLSIGLQSTLEADDGREEGRLLSAEVSCFWSYLGLTLSARGGHSHRDGGVMKFSYKS